MKKGRVAIIALAVLFAACKDRQTTQVWTGMAAEEDSIHAAAATDAEEGMEQMPTGADELFDDFFFNYASSLQQQQERTVFPLPVVDGDRKRTISKKQWRKESFFINQDYYTVIFDTPEQMALVADTTVDEAVVERIALEKGSVERFLFSRKSGRWMLQEVEWQPLARNNNAQFLKFYQQFVGDSVFQHKCLAQQIVFSGPDPDDDFSTIEGMITPDFWEAFRPELPQQVLYNIVYGRQDPATNCKILLLRGIANGSEVEITFQQHRGRWKLTKLIM